MLSIRDVKIDASSLGEKMLLVDVRPAYEYQNGVQFTATATGIIPV